jgi:hypothetical protein
LNYVDEEIQGISHKDGLVDYDYLSLEGVRQAIPDVNDPREQHKSLHIMEPDARNPSSRDSVASVLREIAAEMGVEWYGGERKFLIVCCDGLPYSRIIDLLLLKNHCTMCNKECNIAEHEDARICEFDWCLPVIGVGHEEKNMLRCFAHITWNIFYRDLTEVLGLSDKASEALKDAKDHHKAYEALLVSVYGLAAELVYPYVRQCRNESKSPTPADFARHVQTTGLSERLLHEIIFKYGVSLLALRIATRTQSPGLLISARETFSTLFFVGSHRIYQRIEAFDLALRAHLPSDILSSADTFITFPRDSTSRSAEAFDYQVEMINRDIKSQIKNVIPTEKQWEGYHAAAIKSKEVRQKYMEVSGTHIYKYKAGERHNIDDLIRKWRTRCRLQLVTVIKEQDQLAALRAQNGLTTTEFIGFSSSPLDRDIAERLTEARELYETSAQRLMLRRPMPHHRVKPLSTRTSANVTDSDEGIRQRIQSLALRHGLSVEDFVQGDIRTKCKDDLLNIMDEMEYFISEAG